MKGDNEKYYHNEKLLQLQNEYLETKSLETWHNFFSMSFEVCRNIVISELLKNKKYFTQDEIYEYAINACVYVLRRYKTIGYKKINAAPENYKVTKNFISVFQCGVRHALYYSTTETRMFNESISYESISKYVSYSE